MSKYIDAEKLKAEIEKRLKNTRDYMTGSGMKYKGPKYYKAQGKESAYDALLSIIDSLQQEQAPEEFDTKAFQDGVKEGRRLEREEQGQSKEGVVCDNNEFIKFPDGSFMAKK